MAKEKSAETPLMKQHNEIKAKYPDAVLLFRVGDFYETFGEDAIIVARNTAALDAFHGDLTDEAEEAGAAVGREEVADDRLRRGLVLDAHRRLRCERLSYRADR